MIADILIYSLIGVVAGFLSGLLGIGGGIVIVPSLVFIFALQHFPSSMVMHLAAGTSLTIMIATTASSLAAHLRRGATVWPVAKTMFIGIIIGAIAGVILADYLHSFVLKMIFGIILLVTALRMFFPMPEGDLGPPNRVKNSIAAVAIGWISGMLGIGGGAFTVPYLSYHKVPMGDAVAIAVCFGFMIAITGTIGFMITGLNEAGLPAYTIGYIYWPAAVCAAIFSPFAAFLGSKVSRRLPVPILKRIFAVFILLVAVTMLI